MGFAMLSNRYGRFDATGRTFIISDHKTPSPWTNVVCNGRYGFVISQNGGGFSWLDNSQLNVLTRWDMDLIRDDRGRFLYLSDLDTDEVWSASPAPCWPKYDHYECRHTQGSTTFITEHAGIRAEWTLAVPPEDTLELWHIRLTNTGSAPRRLRLASFFEWCCGVAPDVKREFHHLFITVKHDEARSAIIATKNMWDVPQKNEKEHWNRPWPYIAGHALIGAKPSLALGDKALFLGRYGEQRSPAAMTGKPATSGFGRFGDSSASLGADVTLAPGETKEFGYTLAIAPSERELNALLDRYNSLDTVRAGVAAATKLWDTLLAPTSIETESPDFDIMNSAWLPYQAISARLWGRTGYYQQSGAFGFRDQLQDSHVWLPIDPERTRAQILLHAAHQFANGSVYHWWHPVVEFGLRTACTDDYLWLPMLVVSYIKETGDSAILDELAPFVDDEKPVSLLEHCLRSFRRSFERTSPRGLPLIGSCDWNDGLSAMGVEERGESTWLAFFLIALLPDFAHVLRTHFIGCHGRDGASTARPCDARTVDTNTNTLAADLESRAAALTRAVNEHAWDGKWFRRATKDNGEWIGSSSNSAGRIYLNAQTWAILADAADEKRSASAWRAVKEHLLGDMGPLLLDPAYTIPEESIGYITRYSPGSRENGGVYMHAATWALMAACKLKDAETAGRIWRSISPPARTAALGADAYVAEPYVTPGNVDGPLSDTPGRAGWTWYTGSAAWLNRVSLEWVLGIRPVWDGLLIDPCPFPELGRVDVARTWRGRRIRIRFDANSYPATHGAATVRERVASADSRTPTVRERVAPRLTLSGAPFAGNLLRESDLPNADEIVIDVSWTASVGAPGSAPTSPPPGAGEMVQPRIAVTPTLAARAAQETVR